MYEKKFQRKGKQKMEYNQKCNAADQLVWERFS
jgi:hypothetical protein